MYRLGVRPWQVIALDFVPQAIAAARRLDPRGTVEWVSADVTRLDRAIQESRPVGAATLVVDDGCLHGIAGPDRWGWAATVNMLAASGAHALIRAVPTRRRALIAPAGIERVESARILGSDWKGAESTVGAAPPADWHEYIRVANREGALAT